MFFSKAPPREDSLIELAPVDGQAPGNSAYSSYRNRCRGREEVLILKCQLGERRQSTRASLGRYRGSRHAQMALCASIWERRVDASELERRLGSLQAGPTEDR